MAQYYKVMSGNDCYGVSNKLDQAQKIVEMHKTTKSGHNKETKASTMTYRIDTVQGEYPPQNWTAPPLGYKPGRYNVG